MNEDGELMSAGRRQQLISVSRLAVGLAAWPTSGAWAAQPKRQPNASKTATKPEKRNIIIATSQPAALPYLPLLVAQHHGFFAQQGIELQISEQQSAARSIAAVGVGQADMVCGWLENMLSAPGRALALQSFVLLGAAPMMALGVPTRALGSNESVVTELAALRGRKIGIVSLNSPTHTVALAALRNAGLRAGDVRFVSVGSPASATAALRSGQIDALVQMDPLMLELEQRGELLTLADMRSPAAAYAVLGMHLPSSCVAAPQEFLLRYPGTAQACSDALVQALQWLARASLRDVLRLQDVLAQYVQSLDAQSFVASFARIRTAFCADGVCSQQMATHLLSAMHEAEPTLRLEKIDAERSVTNAFVQRSKLRLKA